MGLLIHFWFHVLNFILSVCRPNFADVSSAMLQRIWMAATVGRCRILSKGVFGMTEQKKIRIWLMIQIGTASSTVVLCTLCHHPIAGSLTFTPFHTKNVQHPAPKLQTPIHVT
jgi:hypothetical protein